MSFEDAATVFLDPLAISVYDQDHSTDEIRYATIGTTRTGHLLVVIHTNRGRSVRIITAWPATPAERRSYEQAPRR
ncbi:MAG: BrnT family toxin [Chloroflexota bacterium]